MSCFIKVLHFVNQNQGRVQRWVSWNNGIMTTECSWVRPWTCWWGCVTTCPSVAVCPVSLKNLNCYFLLNVRVLSAFSCFEHFPVFQFNGQDIVWLDSDSIKSHKKPWLEQVTCDFCENDWVWFCGKTQKSDQSRQKQKEPLSALSVILDALGLVYSCHGSFGWTFVLMWTNGLHHFLPEHPLYYPYMLAHTHFPSAQ